MKNNYFYFKYSSQNPEMIIDPFYEKGLLVIPQNKNETNELVVSNNNLIELITAFKVNKLANQNVDFIINKICEILDTTENINFSSFCQYFMVHNMSFSVYKKLETENKKTFIEQIILKYLKERHEIYLNHGYSNIVLQVMSDNYSHKRNGKTGINKIENLLANKISKIYDISEIERNDIYFLPDKGDKILFEKFLEKYQIKMQSRQNDQEKYPDIVFKHNNHFFIGELKTMKESGGGQNKQMTEIISFIKNNEENDNIHYFAFIDGIYPNELFKSNQKKILIQRENLITALNQNSKNYFVNTAGMKLLINDIFKI